MSKSTDYFIWTESQLGLGIKKMDTEHQVLIGIMNSLHSRQKDGATKFELAQIAKNLLDYTQKHFHDEEEYMESINYPDIAGHRQLHGVLVEKLAYHIQQFNEGPGTISTAFFEFLKSWLTVHIQKADQKYSKHSQGLS